MKAYAIALIACGSAVAALAILCCLWNIGRKKKKTKYPPATRSLPAPVPPRTYNTDVEKGEGSKTSGNKYGQTAVLAAAGTAGVAAVATTAAVTSTTTGGGGGGGGGYVSGGGGCGGGGCGGGGCGGGGCGGGGCGG